MGSLDTNATGGPNIHDDGESFRPLDPEDVRSYLHKAVDFVADYFQSVESLPVLPDVQPGYLRGLLNPSPPATSAPFDVAMKELRAAVVPGMTHWASPNFFAFFPATNSAAAIAGDLIASAMNTVGFTWQAAPAATELEALALDWLAQLLRLPASFMNRGDVGGGGVILGTASEAMLVTLVAARDAALRRRTTLPRLVVYAIDQTHATFFKACRLAGFDAANVRTIPTGACTDYALDAAKLHRAMQADVDAGLVPAYVCATLGTTSTNAVDPVGAVAGVAAAFGAWVHVDAAYAGAACICPEFRHHLNGVERVDSVSVSPHKWLLTCLDCACLWVRDKHRLTDSLETNPEYLRNDASESGVVTDLKDMQVGVGHSFRGLKLWMVMRTYGAAKLQPHIRSDVAMAKMFEEWVRADDRFEVVVPRKFALVCFRIRPQHGAMGEEENADEANHELMARLNTTGKVYLAHTVVGGGGMDVDDFRAKLHVLSVDDDRVSLMLIEKQLRHCRYNVTTVMHAETALEMLRARRDANQFDLVITDVHMPGMDGFKLLELIGLEMDIPVIRAKLRSVAGVSADPDKFLITLKSDIFLVYIIVLSANDTLETMMKGIKHGALNYLVKPVGLEQLKNLWIHVVAKIMDDPSNSINNYSDDGHHQLQSGDSEDENVANHTSMNSRKKKKEDGTREDKEAKRQRIHWSGQLHRLFVEVVHQLGIDKAVPKKIVEMMNVEGLTRDHVASHLQRLDSIAQLMNQRNLSIPLKDMGSVGYGTSSNSSANIRNGSPPLAARMEATNYPYRSYASLCMSDPDPSDENRRKTNRLSRLAASSGQNSEFQNQMAALTRTTTPMAGVTEQVAPFNVGSNTNSTVMQNYNSALGGASSVISDLPSIQMYRDVMQSQMLNGGDGSGSLLDHQATADQLNNESLIGTSSGQNGLSDDLDDFFSDCLNQDVFKNGDAFMDGDCEFAP
ncbi:hypothetical protein EJB05_28021, partial [Eragrostis curvula]